MLMFKVAKKGANRIDFEFSGKLDSEAMEIALDELFSSAKDIEHGHMLCRVIDYDLPKLGAIGVELSRLLETFRFIKKFVRAAVLANKNWVKRVSEIEGILIPGLEIKAFNMNEEAEAEAWLGG